MGTSGQDNGRTRVALVTGASRGIGAGIARRLAVDGWSVACAATAAANADDVVASIEADGGSAMPVAMMVEDPASVEAGFSTVEQAWGPATLVVNNAGISGVSPLLETDVEAFANLIDINVKGVFNGSKVGASRMVAAGVSGSIIQIGSIAGVNGFPNRVGYCSSKAAVHMMTKVLGAELAPHKIRVNAVAPGYIGTDLVQELLDDGRLDQEPLLARIPMGAIGVPDDIAAAVSWLASNESRYVTGETLFVDGGWTAYGHV